MEEAHEDCEGVKSEGLSKEEYKKYVKKCGRRPTSEESEDTDCDSVDWEGMSIQEVSNDSV